MFGIGIPELMLILVLALVVLGPDKLPQLAKQIAKFVGELKRASEDFKEQLDVEGLDDIKKLKEMTNLKNPETWKKNFEKMVSADMETGNTSDSADNNTTDEKGSDLPGGLGPGWKVAGHSGEKDIDVVNPPIDPAAIQGKGPNTKKHTVKKASVPVPEK